MSEKNKAIGFYFSGKDRKLQYGDDREIIKGETHRIEGKIEPCKRGLHASRRLIDALKYAPGGLLWLVEVDDFIESDDKLCGRSRKYIDCIDADEILREFSRKLDAEADDHTAAWSASDAAVWAAACSAERSCACSTACSSAAEELLKEMVRKATGWKI